MAWNHNIKPLETADAVEKYLFYVQSRNHAREVLSLVASDYLERSVTNSDELKTVEETIEELLKELDLADKILHNRTLEQ